MVDKRDMSFDKIIDWVLVIFGLFISYQIFLKIIGGSWGADAILASLMIASLGMTWKMQRDLGKTETKLTQKISKTETTLSEKISKLDSKLSTRISKTETKLSKEMSKLDSKLSEKISKIETKLSGDISKLDSKFERHLGWHDGGKKVKG